MTYSFEYVNNYGITLEKTYPYEDNELQCDTTLEYEYYENTRGVTY